eukprot:TRINITY_DN71017_c0_g1_i1.p1 TRINITY_DN71017_c0_g1~~TRINITY_DN71017_c0_g1_i1.p1  ORF type:complete len:343 (+),score=139.35 TRINITY_DN71017_c0_g1_i1:71-1030(+)
MAARAPLFTARGVAEWAPLLAFGAAGSYAISSAFQRENDAQRRSALRRELFELRSERRAKQAAHEREMRTLEHLTANAERMRFTLEQLWEERLRRYESGIVLADEFGKALLWVQWQQRKLQKWLDHIAQRFVQQRMRGTYGEYEVISARMHSMLLAMPPESFDDVVRLPGVLQSVGNLSNMLKEDPLLRMMEASVSHLTEVPALDGEGGLTAAFNAALDAAAPHAPELAAQVRRLDRGPAGAQPLQRKPDVQHAVSAAMALQEELTQRQRQSGKGEVPPELGAFIRGGADWLMAEQALAITDAYLSTLQMTLTQSRSSV